MGKGRLTSEVQQAFVDAILTGTPLAQVSRRLHIKDSVRCEWEARGRSAHPSRPSTPVYERFARAMQAARDEREQRVWARVPAALPHSVAASLARHTRAVAVACGMEPVALARQVLAVLEEGSWDAHTHDPRRRTERSTV